jgi:MFS family permease
MARKREGSSNVPAAESPSPADHPPATGVARGELYGTVFGTGAAVMVIEILGTRVIGPVFGVSLFVWSALLAVTLGSLAVGYYAGGALVDRHPRRQILGLLVAGSGALLGLTPLLRRPVLLCSESLGARGGALLSAFLLFAPALAALGAVGPVVVRLATEDYRAAGRRVGSVYAISTAGSLIGTLVTGFELVPAFDVDRILLGTAVLLVLLGAVPLALRGRPAALLALLLPGISLAAPAPRLPAGIVIVERAQRNVVVCNVPTNETWPGVRSKRWAR